MGEELFSFKMSLYPGATEGDGYADMSKVDGRVMMRLGCSRIVYLHKFLMSMLVRKPTQFILLFTLQTIVVCFHLCPSLCCCVYVLVSVSVVKIVKAVKGNFPSPMSSRLLLWSVCPSLPVYLICPVLLMSSVLSGFLLLSVYACWRGTTKKKPASARLPLHHFFFFFYLTLNPDQPV